jgi:hypothetical protein
MCCRFNRFLSVVAFIVLATTLASPGNSQDGVSKPDGTSKLAKDKSPVSVNDPRAFPGYTLIAPLQSTTTTLVDVQGRVVRAWESDCHPGQTAYLLENGHILRPGKSKPEDQFFEGAGQGGRIQEFTWDGELVWDFKFSNEKQQPHHDVCRMPNGHVLMLVWDRKSVQESIGAGRKASAVRGDYLYDSIIEIKPTGKTTGEVVWEWHLWDHLIQDQDKSKANYGDVAAHPELIDVNFGHDQNFGGFGGAGGAPGKDQQKKADAKKDDMAKLKAIGYVGAGRGRGPLIPDWPHLNAVDYNAELDQIMVSSRLMSEFWIIDHSTSKAEAAGHARGKSGRGGDLLYRWGNPRAYRAGTAKDQTLFNQHHAHWIPKGLPGEGHVLVYNNGTGRADGNYSSVDEIVLPVDREGRYALQPGTAYGPDKAVWSYTAPKKTDFNSWIISGAHRLPNGNTLICEGMSGTIFEVTPDKELVWKYKNSPQSVRNPFTGPSKPGQVLSPALQDALKLTAEQKQQVTELQTAVDGQLGQTLLDEQKQQFKEIQDGKSVTGGFPPHGQILTPFLHARLKLTAPQKQQLEELQKTINAQLGKTLDDDQKKHLKAARASAAPSLVLNLLNFGFGNMFDSAVFRAYRYAPDHPALAGRDLSPAKTSISLTPTNAK